jgi:hypothetical protein
MTSQVSVRVVRPRLLDEVDLRRQAHLDMRSEREAEPVGRNESVWVSIVSRCRAPWVSTGVGALRSVAASAREK